MPYRCQYTRCHPCCRTISTSIYVDEKCMYSTRTHNEIVSKQRYQEGHEDEQKNVVMCLSSLSLSRPCQRLTSGKRPMNRVDEGRSTVWDMIDPKLVFSISIARRPCLSMQQRTRPMIGDACFRVYSFHVNFLLNEERFSYFSFFSDRTAHPRMLPSKSLFRPVCSFPPLHAYCSLT